MERVDHAAMAHILLFVGEPDTELSETQLSHVWRQVQSLWWVCQNTSACLRHWYDNVLDIAFHH